MHSNSYSNTAQFLLSAQSAQLFELLMKCDWSMAKVSSSGSAEQKLLGGQLERVMKYCSTSCGTILILLSIVYLSCKF